MKKWSALIGLVLPLVASAQTYSIDWYKIAGGGGTSSGTNGSTVYSISGTIGQQDAGTAMTGGNYSLTGGFWSIIALVQSVGAPTLSIATSGNSAIVSWPYPSAGFVLQTNSSLSSGVWGNYSGTVTTNAAGTSNTVTITPPAGHLFFRLGP